MLIKIKHVLTHSNNYTIIRKKTIAAYVINIEMGKTASNFFWDTVVNSDCFETTKHLDVGL